MISLEEIHGKVEKTMDLSSNLLAQSTEGRWRTDVGKTIALESPDCSVFASVSLRLVGAAQAKNSKMMV